MVWQSRLCNEYNSSDPHVSSLQTESGTEKDDCAIDQFMNILAAGATLAQRHYAQLCDKSPSVMSGWRTATFWTLHTAPLQASV